MGLYENMARLKEANLCNIVLVPSRLSASGRNKLYYHYHPPFSLKDSSIYTIYPIVPSIKLPIYILTL